VPQSHPNPNFTPHVAVAARHVTSLPEEIGAGGTHEEQPAASLSASRSRPENSSCIAVPHLAAP